MITWDYEEIDVMYFPSQKKEDIMWISFDYQGFVKGNFIGLICKQ
jgi:hypothetical protein